MITNIEFIASNGERVGLLKPPFHLYGTEGLFGDVQAQHFTSVVSSMSGSRYFGSRLEPRNITLSIKIRRTATKTLHELRQELSRVCNPMLGLGKLHVTIANGRETKHFYINCVADGFPQFADHKNGKSFQNATVFMYAPNPMWQSENIIEEPIFEPLFTFPTSGPFQMGISRDIRSIINDGAMDTPLVIEFIGYAENPKIINQTTGEFIKVNRVIEQGETLIVDTDAYTKGVTIVKANGVREDAFQFIDAGSSFFQLVIGENVIVYEADSNYQSSITNIKYNKLYSSI